MTKIKRICGLITDFGSKDYFVGTLRGVMKQIAPELEIIDICNEIPSFNILAAAFVLEKTYLFFPGQTIFLVVVDPGVGTSRRMLLVQLGKRFFIAPDNGVLTPILTKDETKISILDKKDIFLTRGISTFEARDKMAPAAAYLASGVEPEHLSSPLQEDDGAVIVDTGYYPQRSGNTIHGQIIYIDKYGNVMTNITQEFLSTVIGEISSATFKVIIKGREIIDHYDTYGQAVNFSKIFMVYGSHGNLELAVNRGSAADILHVEIGEPITITF